MHRKYPKLLSSMFAVDCLSHFPTESEAKTNVYVNV